MAEAIATDATDATDDATVLRTDPVLPCRPSPPSRSLTGVDAVWLVVTAGAAFAAVALVAIVDPRRLRFSSPTAVLVLAVVGAVLGALAPGDPTRLAVLDVILEAAFGAAFVLAAATAGPRVRLVAAVIVAIPPLFATGGDLPAMLAFGAALATIAVGTDGAVLGAAVGLAVGQAALRLGWPHTTGLSALFAGVAFLVLVVAALGATPRRSRRRLVVPVAIVGGAVVLVVGVYAVMVLVARGDVNQGIDAANAGLAAARQGDTVLAAKEFDQARQSFADAHDLLDAWWGKPVLAVPGAAQQARALDQMSEIGITLAASGNRTSLAADPAATRMTGGTVPLEKIAALEAPLTEARQSLRVAGHELGDIDATWLVAPIDDKLSELRSKVTHAARDAATGILAAKVVPALLGADGQTKRYFIAFQTPAEQRASGGIIGNYAVVSFTDGHLTKDVSGRDGDLNAGGEGHRTITGPADYVARYGQYNPQSTWQNVTFSPDWPSVADVIEQLYPQSGGVPVDGAISVDPAALAAFLQLTGPVTVDGLDMPLTADNAKDFLLRDQYLKYPDLQERVDILGNAVDAVIDRLQHGDLPGAATIGKVLAPMVRQGRLKVQSVDAAGEQFLTRIHADGALPPVRGDFAGIATQNASGNKIELFLHRSLTYEAVVDPVTKTVHAVATITLRNDAPSSGLPDYIIKSSSQEQLPLGHYRGIMSFYTPLALQQASIDGVPMTPVTETERGRNVITRVVDLDSGGTATIRLELAGPVQLPKVKDGRRYRLTVWHQPTIEPDEVKLQVSGKPPSGLHAPRGLADQGSSVAREAKPQHDLRVGVTVERP
jgi:hypothetical protein